MVISMDKNDSKAFLQRAFNLYQDLDCKIEQFTRLQSLAQKVTSIIGCVPSTENNHVSFLENAIVELNEQSLKIQSSILVFVTTVSEIAEVISKVENDDERLVLSYRYLAFRTWNDIAGKLNFSTQHIYRLHGNALLSVSDIVEKKMRVNESK